MIPRNLTLLIYIFSLKKNTHAHYTYIYINCGLLISFHFIFLIYLSVVHDGQGKGQTIVIGAGNDHTVQVNLLSLLFGGTLKGCVFGGLKSKTDLPIIIDKCKNKVNFNYNVEFVHNLLTKKCGCFMFTNEFFFFEPFDDKKSLFVELSKTHH